MKETNLYSLQLNYCFQGAKATISGVIGFKPGLDLQLIILQHEIHATVTVDRRGSILTEYIDCQTGEKKKQTQQAYQ